MKPSTRVPKLQVLRQPSGKNPRAAERAAIFMVIGVFMLGVYGQYSGRGPGGTAPQSRPPSEPVLEFQRLGATAAERTAANSQRQQPDHSQRQAQL